MKVVCYRYVKLLSKDGGDKFTKPLTTDLQYHTCIVYQHNIQMSQIRNTHHIMTGSTATSSSSPSSKMDNPSAINMSKYSSE